MPVRKLPKDVVEHSPEETSREPSGAEETRTRILDAAQHLFAARGFDATPTKAIAQQAGVPGGLIFYYFPTKKALLESLIAERNLLQDIQSIVSVPTGNDARNALITLAKNYLAIMKRHEQISRIMLREFRNHEDVANTFQKLREEQLRLITAYFAEALQAANLQPVNGEKGVQVMARVFLYNLLTIGLIDRIPDVPQFLREMVDLLLCGTMPLR